MCFWQNREVFSFPGRREHSILVAFLAGVRKGRKKVIVAPFRFLSNARYAGYRTRIISHIRYTSWLKSYEVFWSFSYIWFGFLCAQVFFGNYEAMEWKFAILSLKPRSHVRILMYRKWTGCGGVALALLKKKQKANCGDKHEEMDLQPTINENVSREKLYLLQMACFFFYMQTFLPYFIFSYFR